MSYSAVNLQKTPGTEFGTEFFMYFPSMFIAEFACIVNSLFVLGRLKHGSLSAKWSLEFATQITCPEFYVLVTVWIIDVYLMFSYVRFFPSILSFPSPTDLAFWNMHEKIQPRKKKFT